MSDENVEIVNWVYEQFARSGDLPWELVAPDVEFDASDTLPDFGILREREAFDAMLRAYAGSFEDFHIDLKEVIAADEIHVVTSVRDGGRLKGGDAEVWNDFFHVFTLREGKIVRWSSHLDRARALEAAGLRE
jgi:ketosteroid isomerase-like protein